MSMQSRQVHSECNGYVLHIFWAQAITPDISSNGATFHQGKTLQFKKLYKLKNLCRTTWKGKGLMRLLTNSMMDSESHKYFFFASLWRSQPTRKPCNPPQRFNEHAVNASKVDESHPGHRIECPKAYIKNNSLEALELVHVN